MTQFIAKNDFFNDTFGGAATETSGQVFGGPLLITDPDLSYGIGEVDDERENGAKVFQLNPKLVSRDLTVGWVSLQSRHYES